MKNTNLAKLSLGLGLPLLLIAATHLTITINNSVDAELGQVTLHYGTEQSGVFIGGVGVYYVSLGGSPSAITIAGQTLQRPNTGPITLPSNQRVEVLWNTGYVNLEDPDQVDFLKVR